MVSAMPAAEDHSDKRGGWLVAGMFWGGVGLAPLAALLLALASGSGLLRFAVGLVVLSIVLIGLSLTLRSESDSWRVEAEDLVLDEIDAFRDDIRGDIEHAANT